VGGVSFLISRDLFFDPAVTVVAEGCSRVRVGDCSNFSRQFEKARGISAEQDRRQKEEERSFS
jgi:hypothetical protein